MLEIGGYRELDLRIGNELYKGDNVARLNAGRYGIFHAIRCLDCDRVLLPYYQCSTVKNYLNEADIKIEFYHIGNDMLPDIQNNNPKTAMVIVNYFGIIRRDVLFRIARKNCNVIVDNTQAFFEKGINGTYSIYSPRKFVGVPDGAYVIGNNVKKFENEYDISQSSSTSSFLLSRIETGGNKNYDQYLLNEERITDEGVRQMSILTRALLDNIDYAYIKKKRIENYFLASKYFQDINELEPVFLSIDEDRVPMVYPLLIKNDFIRNELKQHSIFVGQWWKYLIDNPDITEWERYLSKYLIPIQIDQRYGAKEIKYVSEFVHKIISEEKS